MLEKNWFMLLVVRISSFRCTWEVWRALKKIDLIPPREPLTLLVCSLNFKRTSITRYSCFEKGCPTKPYATMPKGITGNGGSWSLIEDLGVSAT